MSAIRKISRFRGVIEGFSAKMAAIRVAEGVSTEPLLQAFEFMQKEANNENYLSFHRTDVKLHLAIVKLADVPTLREVWFRVAKSYNRFWVKALRDLWPDLDLLIEGHRDIVDAVCAGDPYTAEDAAIAHHDTVWYRLADYAGAPNLPNNPLERACSFIAMHLDHDIHLSFLAKTISRVNTGHLARLFVEKYGVNFTTYVQHLRMRKAVQWLLHTNKPIAQIARRVGYNDPSRFAEHFHRIYGQSPSLFRIRTIPGRYAIDPIRGGSLLAE